jgi:hypothetical protein
MVCKICILRVFAKRVDNIFAIKTVAIVCQDRDCKSPLPPDRPLDCAFHNHPPTWFQLKRSESAEFSLSQEGFVVAETVSLCRPDWFKILLPQPP